jgi:hypothetical protein
VVSPQAWRLNPVIESRAETTKSLLDGLRHTLTMQRRSRVLSGNGDIKSLSVRLTSTLGEAHLLAQEQSWVEKFPSLQMTFSRMSSLWGFPCQKTTRVRDVASLHCWQPLIGSENSCRVISDPFISAFSPGTGGSVEQNLWERKRFLDAHVALARLCLSLPS